MATSANLGFPRFGVKREWKRATEQFWAEKRSETELLLTAEELMKRHWKLQMDAGIHVIPVNDFSYYDHMLDMVALLGAIPERYQHESGHDVKLDTYFAMARGRQDRENDVTAMEMTKWFDTNYHYIVPEFDKNTQFSVSYNKPFDVLDLARQFGVRSPRPVIVGPVSFLMLGKVLDSTSLADLLERILPVYRSILRCFAARKVEWVQIDEPVLAFDLTDEQKEFFRVAYANLRVAEKRPELMITTYFGSVVHNCDLIPSLGRGLHVDLVRAPEQLTGIMEKLREDQVLSLGVVDGRNVWRTDLEQSSELIGKAVASLGKDRIQIAPSCSLLHAPIDLRLETRIDDEIIAWLAFAVQKLEEISVLTRAANEGRAKVEDAFVRSRKRLESRSASHRVVRSDVQERLDSLDEFIDRRPERYEKRIQLQREKLKLPKLPTTTIGSFPQTREIRQIRAQYKKRKISYDEYESKIQSAILETIRFQEEMGLDVLVHGEFERNDMVEYFGEQLEGFLFTDHGWVQSYGSRGVKPPIIYGDVRRRNPMTVKWSRFAEQNTNKPVKGMLTGPVTMMQWSFVRDDQLRAETCKQLALVIRDEVVDLEATGIDVIQIDEPAIREGLPLRRSDWGAYFDWAIRCFRIASSGVRSETQIHTHMCYSEFNDMIEAIAAMDADVISIEASRSRMELLDSFDDFVYPNDIGPGVWDIHSPRVPSKEEMVELLHKAIEHVPVERLWVNPDCGLKTRGWTETRESIGNMVAAAKEVREDLE